MNLCYFCFYNYNNRNYIFLCIVNILVVAATFHVQECIRYNYSTVFCDSQQRCIDVRNSVIDMSYKDSNCGNNPESLDR